MYKCFDIHAHYVPEVYKKALLGHGVAGKESDGLPAPAYTPEQYLGIMKKFNIKTALLSLASPHTNLGSKQETVELTRAVNEDGAALCKQYSNIFHLAATLPLPYTDEALAEIDYVRNNLHFSVFKLPTSAGGIYIGDSRLDEVFAKLNEIKAVVILHPVDTEVKPRNLSVLPGAVVGYMLETTIAVSNLFVSGTMEKYPGIKLVVPHGGTFLPALYDRLCGMQA